MAFCFLSIVKIVAGPRRPGRSSQPAVPITSHECFFTTGSKRGAVSRAGQACRLVKFEQEPKAGCLWFNRVSCRVERIGKFAKRGVCWHVSHYPSLAATAMLRNLDQLVWREAQPGLARIAREGHGFDVFQPENNPALNGHNNVTLLAARGTIRRPRQPV